MRARSAALVAVAPALVAARSSGTSGSRAASTWPSASYDPKAPVTITVWQSRPTVAGNDETSQHVGQEIAKVLQGQETTKQALDNAAAASADALSG